MRSTFSKFGEKLATPEGYSLKVPSSFKQRLNFGGTNSVKESDLLKGT